MIRNGEFFQEPAAQKALVGLQSTLLPFVPMILWDVWDVWDFWDVYQFLWLLGGVQAVGYPLGTLVIGRSEWALWMQDTLAATVVFVEQ